VTPHLQETALTDVSSCDGGRRRSTTSIYRSDDTMLVNTDVYGMPASQNPFGV